MKFTEPQKNSIRTVLLILEECINEINKLCMIDEERGVLYTIKNTLSEKERRKLLCAINSLKNILKHLKQQLNLEVENRSTKDLVISRLASLWESLYSINSKALRSYGNIDESTERIWEPIVKQLIKTVDNIVDSLHSKI
jgi:hypothetical protein